MLKTLLDTGARVNELAKLKLEDIFFREDLFKLDGKVLIPTSTVGSKGDFSSEWCR